MEKLIKEKKYKIEVLKDDIETLELQQRYEITLNVWYKNSEGTMFFRPTSIHNDGLVGFSISLDKYELSYNIYDDTVSLQYYFSNMQASSYGEMLNAVNSHNLDVLKQYK